MKRNCNDIWLEELMPENPWLERVRRVGIIFIMALGLFYAEWVAAAVEIKSQTGSLNKTSGQNAYMDVVAIGKGTLSYQWYKDGAVLSRANKNFFWKSGVTVADAGYYLVKIRDLDGIVQSKSVLLKVDGKSSSLVSAATVSSSSSTLTATTSAFTSVSGSIVITSLTNDLSKNSGQSASMAVKATGSGALSYQWFKDGVILSRGTKNIWWIGGVVKADAGRYTVKVTDSKGSVVSSQILLKVDGYLPNTTVASTSSATINWGHPGKREDGSSLPFSAVVKYRIFHSLPNNSGSKVYEVVGGKYQLTVSSLASGTHYFAVQAVDSAGLESDLSGLVSKRIQ